MSEQSFYWLLTKFRNASFDCGDINKHGAHYDALVARQQQLKEKIVEAWRAEVASKRLAQDVARGLSPARLR